MPRLNPLGLKTAFVFTVIVDGDEPGKLSCPAVRSTVPNKALIVVFAPDGILNVSAAPLAATTDPPADVIVRLLPADVKEPLPARVRF